MGPIRTNHTVANLNTHQLGGLSGSRNFSTMENVRSTLKLSPLLWYYKLKFGFPEDKNLSPTSNTVWYFRYSRYSVRFLNMSYYFYSLRCSHNILVSLSSDEVITCAGNDSRHKYGCFLHEILKLFWLMFSHLHFRGFKYK